MRRFWHVFGWNIKACRFKTTFGLCSLCFHFQSQLADSVFWFLFFIFSRPCYRCRSGAAGCLCAIHSSTFTATFALPRISAAASSPIPYPPEITFFHPSVVSPLSLFPLSLSSFYYSPLYTLKDYWFPLAILFPLHTSISISTQLRRLTCRHKELALRLSKWN